MKEVFRKGKGSSRSGEGIREECGGKCNQGILATCMKLSKMRMNIEYRTVTYIT